MKRADGSPWELGRGNFGIVFKGMRNRVTPVAIKVMSNGPMSTLSSLSLDKKARYLEEFKREILILKSCRSVGRRLPVVLCRLSRCTLASDSPL